MILVCERSASICIYPLPLYSKCSPRNLFMNLSSTYVHAELPVRHNEDKQNEELALSCRLYPNNTMEEYDDDNESNHLAMMRDCEFDDPHFKASLLLQSHFSRQKLPISDYITDTKSVLDQAVRIIQAIVDVGK